MQNKKEDKKEKSHQNTFNDGFFYYRIENKVFYSTVIKSSPTTSNSNLPTQSYSLVFSLQITSANLWESTYSPYQQELFDHITRFHDEGWNFKQISDWLVENNYKTPRGHTFMQKHVWSIYQKKNRSIKRFSREFQDVISDMKIDVVDFAFTNQ